MNIQNIRRLLCCFPEALNLRSPVDDPNSTLSTPFQAVLRALQASSAPADLIPIFENLSALAKGIKQPPANAQSLAEVASLLERLRPIVIELAEIKGDKGQTFVEDLKQWTICFLDSNIIADRPQGVGIASFSSLRTMPPTWRLRKSSLNPRYALEYLNLLFCFEFNQLITVCDVLRSPEAEVTVEGRDGLPI
ncbi:hypothetical protein DFH08DRAFT_92925 [Mycena albidolilacea]|uniref:Uncharacterized protein n=1 Tax=Mycena albidolilacea TaxID=1033008 RepID=A0AAD7EUJ9_9AGAR|nr:hypothetical protein DFH08DRAFT_92925 [Mycena albidolilacea]